MAHLSFWVDVGLIIVLIVTNGYAILLNHRLKKLRATRDDLHVLIERFIDATRNAEQSIQTLRENAKQIETQMTQSLQKGEHLIQDLKFMAEKGDEVASRLERKKAPEVSLATPEPENKNPLLPENPILRAIREMR